MTDSKNRTVSLPDYDWRIIVKLLRAAADRQRKNDAMKHAYTDIANWVSKQSLIDDLLK